MNVNVCLCVISNTHGTHGTHGRTRANGSHGRTSQPSTQTQRHKPARIPRPTQQPQEQQQARSRPLPGKKTPGGSRCYRYCTCGFVTEVQCQSDAQTFISRSCPALTSPPACQVRHRKCCIQISFNLVLPVRSRSRVVVVVCSELARRLRSALYLLYISQPLS